MRELEIIGVGAAAEEAAGPHPERPGDGPKHAAGHAECLNCGATLHGRFCHSCGQTADDHHRSIFHLMWEAVEGLTHLDGRLAKTLPPLLLRPGQLARDHFEGRRQRHVPPFRLFLVALLLFMLALEVVLHGASHGGGDHAAAGGDHAAAPAGSPDAHGAAQAPGGLAEARREAAAAVGLDAPYAVIDGVPPPKSPDAPQLDGIDGGRSEAQAAAAATASRAINGMVRGRNVNLATIDDDAFGDSPFGKWLVHKAKAAGVSPEYFTATMFSWGHRLAVLLLPVFALLLICCYFYKRKFYVYDHLVVSMQFLSFVFLISGIAWVLPEPARGVAVFVAMIWTPINLFMILRGAYGSSVIGALIKTAFLWISAMVVFAALLIGIVALALGQM